MTAPQSFATQCLRSASILAALVIVAETSVCAAEPITEQEAHAIAVDAYVYLYPLVTMDVTRKQLTNTDKGFGRGPMNAFSNVPAYPPASDKTVVRTNYDTLYSIDRLSRFAPGAGCRVGSRYGGPLLSAADAGHVD
jgi:hypothetical protein